MGVNYHLIGKIGTANIAILICIILFRFSRFIRKWEGKRESSKYYRRLLFHICLLLSAIVELPLFIWFIVDGRYNLDAFSFHKFQATFLFAAISLTISDWSTVLYDIHEYKIYTFLFHKFTLIFLNVLYLMISLINFIFCYWTADLGKYTNSPVYVIEIFFQICISMLLTLLMLHAGLKLYGRIQGAAGKVDGSSSSNGTTRDSASNNTSNNLSNNQALNLAVSSSTPRHSNGGNSTSAKVPLLSQVRNTNEDLEAIEPSSSFTQTTTPSSAGSSDRLQVMIPQPVKIMTPPPAITNPLGNQILLPSAGKNSQPYNHHNNNTQNNTSSSMMDNNSAEFRTALINLNIVMATCTFCILLQMIMVVLNYAMGYSNDTDKTLGPPVLFWALYSWIPLWGPVCSLLYLYRSQYGRKSTKTYGGGRVFSIDAPFRSPLIGPADDDSYLYSEHLHSPTRGTGGGAGDYSSQNNLLREFRMSMDSDPANSDTVMNNNGNMNRNNNRNGLASPMDTSRSYGLTSDTNDTDGESIHHLPHLNSNNGNGNPLASPEDSLHYLYRETTATNPLPSELNFANILRSGYNGQHYQNHHDFSYRGEEEHNGQYR